MPRLYARRNQIDTSTKSYSEKFANLYSKSRYRVTDFPWPNENAKSLKVDFMKVKIYKLNRSTNENVKKFVSSLDEFIFFFWCNANKKKKREKLNIAFFATTNLCDVKWNYEKFETVTLRPREIEYRLWKSKSFSHSSTDGKCATIFHSLVLTVCFRELYGSFEAFKCG